MKAELKIWAFVAPSTSKEYSRRLKSLGVNVKEVIEVSSSSHGACYPKDASDDDVFLLIVSAGLVLETVQGLVQILSSVHDPQPNPVLREVLYTITSGKEWGATHKNVVLCSDGSREYVSEYCDSSGIRYCDFSSLAELFQEEEVGR